MEAAYSLSSASSRCAAGVAFAARSSWSSSISATLAAIFDASDTSAYDSKPRSFACFCFKDRISSMSGAFCSPARVTKAAYSFSRCSAGSKTA